MRLCFCLISLSAQLIFAQDQTLQRAIAAEAGGSYFEAERLYAQAVLEAPGRFEPPYRFGLFLYRRGEPDRAKPQFQAAKQADGGRHETYLMLANIALDEGDLTSAEKELTAGAASGATVPEYQLTTAYVASLGGKRSEAVAAIERSLALPTITPPAAFEAGRLAVSLNDRQLAERGFRAAHEGDPANAAFAYGRAANLSQMGKALDAADALLVTLRRSPSAHELAYLYATCVASAKGADAESRINALESLGVPASVVLTARGVLAELADDAVAARAQYTAALALDPRNVEALVRRGRLSVSSDSKAALADAEAAISAQPSLAPAHRLRHSAFEADGNRRGAELALRQWIVAVQRDPEPYNLLGELLTAREAFAEAAATFDAALRLTPRDPRAVERAASANMSAGNAPRSVEIIEAARAKGVSSPDLYVRLALAHRQLSQNAKAIAVLAEMRDAFPADVRGWQLAGSFLESGTQYDAAIAVYRDLDSRRPNHPGAVEGLARCLGLLKRYADSAAAWRRLAESHPDLVAGFLNASSMYVAAGKPEDAEAMWSANLAVRADDLRILGAYGQHLMTTKRFTDAVGIYQRMIALDPDQQQPYVALSEAHTADGKADAAWQAVRQGIIRFHATATYLQLALRAAMKVEKLAEYRDAVTSAIESGKRSYPLLTVYVDVNRSPEELRIATGFLESLAAAEPTSGSILAGLARAYALSGATAKSLDALERAAQADPTNADLVRTYASAAEASRSATRSAEAYALLYVATKHDPAIALKAAGYLMEIGAKDRAVAILRDAKDRHPEHADVAAMLDRIGG